MFGNGYVCDNDDYFDSDAAYFVCKELGYDTSVFFEYLDWNSTVNGVNTMTDIFCPSDAESFSDCSHNTTGDCGEYDGEHDDHAIELECTGSCIATGNCSNTNSKHSQNAEKPRSIVLNEI